MATRQNLVDFAKSKTNPGGEPTCGYVWGAKDGAILTEEYLQKKIKQYGLSHYVFTDGGVKVNANKWMGKQVFDCSGFVHWCCKQLKVSVGSSSTSLLNNHCYTIPKSELQPGDLCFKMKGSYNKSADPAPAKKGSPKGTTTHVAIYIGDGKVAEASGTRWGVIIGKLKDSYNAFGRLVALDDSSYMPTSTAPATQTTTTTTYNLPAGWSKEYIQLNLDNIVDQIAGAGASAEIKHIVKETIVANYLSFSSHYNIGEDVTLEKNNKVDTTEKANETVVQSSLAQLNKNLSNGKITMPINHTIGSASNIKNLCLYFTNTTNVASILKPILNNSQITVAKSLQNKFHPIMIALLEEAAKKFIKKITYFSKQQKITITKGFISLASNDPNLDDKQDYSAHSCGLAVDIEVDSSETAEKAIAILTGWNVTNAVYHADDKAIHIDLGVKL